MRIGIMGGTFDPVHYGHLITAEKVRDSFFMDQVVFVPSGNPPHKKLMDISPAEHRLAMTKLAIDGIKNFSVSSLEIDRKGYSYALDTVNEFLDIYGEMTDLWFITGTDAIAEITSWYRFPELLNKCRFIAASRPGYSENSAVLSDYHDRIVLFEETSLEISSTEIRRRIAAGESVSGMLPSSVLKYILEHKLYHYD